MAGSAVELDFFRMERENLAKPRPEKLFDRRRSFRDIQSVISKLNPELLKTVIASGSTDQTSGAAKSRETGFLPAPKASYSVPATPKHDERPFPALPLYAPAIGGKISGSEGTPETTSMTIFFNGTVAVFEVPRRKAEDILKLAEDEFSKAVDSADPKHAASSTGQTQLLDTLDGDLPIARRKSLQRFLEKRKERLTLASPYPIMHASFGQITWGYQD